MSKKVITGFFMVLIVALTLAVVHLIMERKQHVSALSQLTDDPKQAKGQVGTPLPTKERVKGADISHWDGEIDWVALKDTDIKFLFIKATQGTTYQDPKFKENWETATNYGFYRGAYHFYQPSEDPKTQAEHFLSVVQPQKGDILPVLDIEIAHGMSPEKLTKDVQIWVETVKTALGRHPIIYTYRIFWDASINSPFSQCPLWVAEWENTHPPKMPKGWQHWSFWQYSSKGNVAGIPEAEGKVDLDYFNGNEEALRSYQIR